MAFEPSYSPESPYAFTQIYGRFMTYYVHREVRPHQLDTIITLNNERYVHMPGNLAFDLYGNDDLFWVIPIRNGLQDPVWDLKFGMRLFIPHPSYVRELT